MSGGGGGGLLKTIVGVGLTFLMPGSAADATFRQEIGVLICPWSISKSNRAKVFNARRSNCSTGSIRYHIK